MPTRPLLALLLALVAALASAQATPGGMSNIPLESLPNWSRGTGALVQDGAGGISQTGVGQAHYDYAGRFTAPYSVSLTVDPRGGFDWFGPCVTGQPGTYAVAGLRAGTLQLLVVAGNAIVGEAHTAAVSPGPTRVTLTVAADGTLTAAAGATCAFKAAPGAFFGAAIHGDRGAGPAAVLSGFSVTTPEVLFYLRRLRQYVPVAGLPALDPEATTLYSESWSIEAALPTPVSAANPGGYQPELYASPSPLGQRPEDYSPPSAEAWHRAVDAAPLSIDPAQAGYLGTPADADRRAPTLDPGSVWTVALYWPVYAADAATARARWLDPIYSAGKAMTMDEYMGFVYVSVAVPWFKPTPMPWAGLNALGCVAVKEWTTRLAPFSAPYDAAVK